MRWRSARRTRLFRSAGHAPPQVPRLLTEPRSPGRALRSRRLPHTGTALLNDYHVVLDSLGGDNLARSLRILKPGGTAISVVDRVFPFGDTLRAMEYVEKGRAKAGKVVVSIA
ncbi:hypothetical protein [Streptomyces sp. NPDC001661]